VGVFETVSEYAFGGMKVLKRNLLTYNPNTRVGGYIPNTRVLEKRRVMGTPFALHALHDCSSDRIDEVWIVNGSRTLRTRM
jgi:hypothetical protein